MKAFEKPKKHLQVEDTFRTFYEQSGDTAYQLPHSFDYYEKMIHQAVERYPDSLTLKKCASAIGEEAFFPEGTDVVFHLHLSWFPPNLAYDRILCHAGGHERQFYILYRESGASSYEGKYLYHRHRFQARAQLFFPRGNPLRADPQERF